MDKEQLKKKMDRLTSVQTRRMMIKQNIHSHLEGNTQTHTHTHDKNKIRKVFVGTLYIV